MNAFGDPIRGPRLAGAIYRFGSLWSAAITCADRQLISLLGHGSALTTGQEIATAVQNCAKPIVILFNNDTYGTIRLNQENRYPGRVWRRSFGARGETVERTEDFLTAPERAAACGRAAVIELTVDTDQVLPAPH